jgi:hypothetical protein
MQRAFYTAVGIAVLAFVLWRFWRSDRQETDHPLAMPSAAALSASPTLTGSATIPAPAIASKGAGSDAGETLAAQREPFIQHLHVLETTNPRLAASLALEDRQRFPNSPDAEERDVILVAALHNQRDVDGANSEAWYYFVHHPNGKFTKYLSELTGVSPPTTRPLR